jgi:Tfp pilus assembly protein PilV
MAWLQIAGLRNSAVSTYRTDATQLSYAVADCMRANKMAVSNNQFAMIEYLHGATLIDPQKSCLQATTTSSVASCTTNEMASVDLYGWVIQARQKLPNASMSIQCNDQDTTDADVCTDNSTHTVTLSWNENVDGRIGTNTFSYTFRP